MAKNKKIAISDDEKSELIRLWEGEDVLYRPDHEEYHDNMKRMAALKRIAEEMSIDIDFNQVKDVMKSLRTTFLRERRKEEDSITSGKGTNEIKKSNWKFYEELQFLAPYVKPFPTESSLAPVPPQRNSDYEEGFGEEQNDDEIDMEELGNSRNSIKGKNGLSSSRKKKKASPDDIIFQSSNVLQSVVKRLNQTPSPNFPTISPNAVSNQPRELDGDELFGKTMARLIGEVKDDMQKEMAKIECQQILFRYRFQREQPQNHGHIASQLFSGTPNFSRRSNISSPDYPQYPSTPVPAYRSYESQLPMPSPTGRAFPARYGPLSPGAPSPTIPSQNDLSSSDSQSGNFVNITDIVQN